MHNAIADYVRLMRIPGAAGIALVPVFGAISVNNFSFSLLFPLFVIGILSNICGFVLNDYIDIDLDRLSKNPSRRLLVKGTISKRNALMIFIFCFILAYSMIFIFFYRNQITFFLGLFCAILAEILALIYNLYGKQIIGSDFLLALAESLSFLFGAFMVLTNGNPGFLTWILFILVFNHVLYMNAIEGGLKDADHDYLMNVKNIALASGVKITQDLKVFIPTIFKAFGMGIRIFSVFLVFTPFVFYGLGYELWQIILLIIFAILLLYASAKMLNIRYFDRNKLRKIIVIQMLFRHSFIPIIFISIIGPLYAFVLFVLPFVWHISFSLLVGEQLFKPQI